MGGKKRMDTNDNYITLYSPQATIVWRVVNDFGISYSRREYITDKYEESARIFLTAYDAYIHEAEKIVARSDSSAYPYWAFASLDQVDPMEQKVMKLRVPLDEVVLFDQYDWYKVLRLSYIGETPEDEAQFAKELERRGIRDASDAVLRPFYPDMRRKIVSSWNRLFRYDEAVKKAVSSGDDMRATGIRAVQAGMWCIKKEWLI